MTITVGITQRLRELRDRIDDITREACDLRNRVAEVGDTHVSLNTAIVSLTTAGSLLASQESYITSIDRTVSTHWRRGSHYWVRILHDPYTGCYGYAIEEHGETKPTYESGYAFADEQTAAHYSSIMVGMLEELKSGEDYVSEDETDAG